jgi:hypothetical protein
MCRQTTTHMHEEYLSRCLQNVRYMWKYFVPETYHESQPGKYQIANVALLVR